MTRRSEGRSSAARARSHARGDGRVVGLARQDLRSRRIDARAGLRDDNERTRKAREARRKLRRALRERQEVRGVSAYGSRIRWYVLVCQGVQQTKLESSGRGSAW